MSGLVNKVKEALHSDKSTSNQTTQGTSGPHTSKVANSADPRIDSDRDHRSNAATGTHVGGYQDPAGTHAPGHTTGTHNTNVTGFDDPAGTHGTHNSRVANAADPRIDSDRDHRGTTGTHTGAGGLGSTGTHTGAGGLGSTGTHTGAEGLGSTGTHTGAGGIGSTGHHTGTGAGAGYGSSTVTGYDDPTGTHGTHNSRVANAADPRIDSDRDHRGTHTGVGGIGSTGTHNGAGGIGSTGHTGTHNGAGGIGSTGHTGAHTSSGTGSGFGNSNTTTGYNDSTGTHGTHGNRAANAADPRIDSDRDHRGAPGTAGTHHIGSGPGPAANTAGPHKSDALNKVDPRVDSDLDGSKTFGGNKTYQQTGANSLAHKDPTDAAQVPPSVLRQHVGEPAIEHDDVTHGRHERHQSASHQEAHRGL